MTTEMTELPEEISEVIDPKVASTVANKGTSPEIVLNVLLQFISARKPREFNNGGDRDRNDRGGDRRDRRRSRSRSNDRQKKHRRRSSSSSRSWLWIYSFSFHKITKITNLNILLNY